MAEVTLEPRDHRSGGRGGARADGTAPTDDRSPLTGRRNGARQTADIEPVRGQRRWDCLWLVSELIANLEVFDLPTDALAACHDFNECRDGYWRGQLELNILDAVEIDMDIHR